ncbi:hypothetical protein [Pseudomonas wadenswilerensis]|uniref:hypothetical protein n=1 Tax=Pseudomonas wadenswilerensis TaxID=1785161 RepID=UPI00215FF2C6|nr:hypothetical protein [Pseudomonas wadenswilerensis]UVM20039.1 hypothetical protein LOY45_16425 [Pseudomonas wadenswilerensis]
MKTKESNSLPFIERPDLSPFLIHLTKNTKADDGCSAFDNLVRILKTGKIWGSTKEKGFIKGPNKAACFMDVPFSALKYILNSSNTKSDSPRYEPYGIIVSKTFAHRNGCRPVMYLSNEELRKINIPNEELWRVVRLEGVDGEGINWVHEREWRRKGHFSLPTDPHTVLVKNINNAKKLRKLLRGEREEFKSLPSSIMPLTILCQGLPYKEE